MVHSNEVGHTWSTLSFLLVIRPDGLDQVGGRGYI